MSSNDTLTERRGVKPKQSSGIATFFFLFGIAAVVAGAGIAGLKYANADVWDHPAQPTQHASDESYPIVTFPPLSSSDPTLTAADLPAPAAAVDAGTKDGGAKTEKNEKSEEKPRHSAPVMHPPQVHHPAEPATTDPFATSQ